MAQTENTNKRAFSQYKLFTQKDVSEWIHFLWEVSPNQLKEDFKKYGVIINNDDDINALVNLYQTGNDIKGSVVDKNGKVLSFNTKNIIFSMNIPKSDLNTKGSLINWIG